MLHLCLHEIIIKLDLADERPMPYASEQRLEIPKHTVDHKGIVFVTYSQQVLLTIQERRVANP